VLPMMTDANGEEREDPARTCVGCRKVDTKDALLRFVMSPDHALVPDIAHKLSGRGVSVHPTRACLKAATAGGFSRSFKRAMSVNWQELATLASSQYTRRVEGLIVSAHRAHLLAIGTDAVREAMREQKTELLIVAADAAGRREDLENQAAALGRHCAVFATKTLLGALLGRDEVGVVAVLDSGIASAVTLAVSRAAALVEAE
jgi:predicted RNA-binding protein YlxR (DUF448 family)/ribosomal protein L30E